MILANNLDATRFVPVMISNGRQIDRDVLGEVLRETVPASSVDVTAQGVRKDQRVTRPIRNLHDARLEVVKPIWVAIERIAGKFVAYNGDLLLYGQGNSIADAEEDFRVALAEAYFDFKEIGEQKLGPLPLEQFRLLLRHLNEKGR